MPGILAPVLRGVPMEATDFFIRDDPSKLDSLVSLAFRLYNRLREQRRERQPVPASTLSSFIPSSFSSSGYESAWSLQISDSGSPLALFPCLPLPH